MSCDVSNKKYLENKVYHKCEHQPAITLYSAYKKF